MPKRTCSIDGCDRPFIARGWCDLHYARWKTTGDVGEPESRYVDRKFTLEQRIAHYGWKVSERGCHEWQGPRNSKGYGKISVPGTRGQSYLHRVVYEIANGEIPPGMVVCHSCDNPPCCNLEHLFLGTVDDNAADAVSKRRQPWGERNGSHKLTTQDVREIRALLAQGLMTQRAIAARYGVSPGAICQLGKGKTWKLVA